MRTARYGTHPDQVVDLRGEDGPLVLVIHGGFWRPVYARGIMNAFCEALVTAGVRTANVEYRRPEPGRYREMLDDVESAARLVEPDVAVGHSAGGHLALWLGAERLVQSVVALGAVCDLTLAAELRIGNDAVRTRFGDDFAAADPARRLPLGVDQVLIHGTEDEAVPIEIARSYAERAGDECRLVELDGVGHMELIDPEWDRFDEIIDAVVPARPRPR